MPVLDYVYLERWSRPHHFAIVQNERPSHSVILVIDKEVLLVAGERPHGQQELGQVVAVQGAGLCGQLTRQVCVTHTNDTLHYTRMLFSMKKMS